MTQSVHGHEVMEMMLAQGGQFTRASLKQAIDERFGAKARFHTCSASEMDAEALIDFPPSAASSSNRSRVSRLTPTRFAITVEPRRRAPAALAESRRLCYISPSFPSFC